MKFIAVTLACIFIAALAFAAYFYTTYCTGGHHGIC